jgi:peptide/nickel transport system permease protein
MKHFKNLMKNRFTATAVIVLGIVLFLGAFAPLLTNFNPNDVIPEERLLAPGGEHYFGTDELGRDIFTRIIFAVRVSVGIAFFSIILAALIGTFIGSFSGYVSGWVDQLIMRVTDVLLAFPTLVLALALSAALGPNILNAALAIAIVKLPIYMRLSRTQALTISQSLYVKSAKTYGAKPNWIVKRHIVPSFTLLFSRILHVLHYYLCHCLLYGVKYGF